ncbi:hypothetical protein BJ912DRAFT_255415 [Pholiota molesta]|nr:hypothetical protein BJ912DRAFT_255415 [Pholiota molesta]
MGIGLAEESENMLMPARCGHQCMRGKQTACHSNCQKIYSRCHTFPPLRATDRPESARERQIQCFPMQHAPRLSHRELFPIYYPLPYLQILFQCNLHVVGALLVDALSTTLIVPHLPNQPSAMTFIPCIDYFTTIALCYFSMLMCCSPCPLETGTRIASYIIGHSSFGRFGPMRRSFDGLDKAKMGGDRIEAARRLVPETDRDLVGG